MQRIFRRRLRRFTQIFKGFLFFSVICEISVKTVTKLIIAISGKSLSGFWNMRNAISILVCSFLTLVCLAGCNEPAASNVFPPGVAGTWQADGSPWKIVLSKDGKVKSALVPMGEAEVSPNKTTKFEMKDGKMSHITAGECFAEYKPVERELFVSIQQKDIHIAMGNDALDGNSLDIIKGPVSEDGKTWNAEWINIINYGPRFPQDENDIAPEPLTFRKVEEKKKK